MARREWPLECKVYLGGLPERCDRGEIEDRCKRFGPLRNVWVARNPPGFAFIEYEDPRDANDAARALDGTRICGQRVRAELSHGQHRRNKFERGGGGRGGGYGGGGGGYGGGDRYDSGRDRYDDRYGDRNGGGSGRGYRGRSRSRSPVGKRDRSMSRSPPPKNNKSRSRSHSR